MSRRSTVRRAMSGTFLAILTLLPLADAQAAPAREGAAVTRLALSRLVTETVSQWKDRLVHLIAKEAPPPGQHTSQQSREGSGWDPHGKP